MLATHYAPRTRHASRPSGNPHAPCTAHRRSLCALPAASSRPAPPPSRSVVLLLAPGERQAARRRARFAAAIAFDKCRLRAVRFPPPACLRARAPRASTAGARPRPAQRTRRVPPRAVWRPPHRPPDGVHPRTAEAQSRRARRTRPRSATRPPALLRQGSPRASCTACARLRRRSLGAEGRRRRARRRTHSREEAGAARVLPRIPRTAGRCRAGALVRTCVAVSRRTTPRDVVVWRRGGHADEGAHARSGPRSLAPAHGRGGASQALADARSGAAESRVLCARGGLVRVQACGADDHRQTNGRGRASRLRSDPTAPRGKAGARGAQGALRVHAAKPLRRVASPAQLSPARREGPTRGTFVRAWRVLMGGPGHGRRARRRASAKPRARRRRTAGAHRCARTAAAACKAYRARRRASRGLGEGHARRA